MYSYFLLIYPTGVYSVTVRIENECNMETGENMQALIAIIVALAVTVAVLWFFFAPRKAFRARVDNGVQEAVVEVKGGENPALPIQRRV